jgi:hypothetical protein
VNQPRDNRANFEAWFGSKLEAMFGDPDAGFVVAIATFPLLERYIREVSGGEPNKPPFNQALTRVFPELVDEATANRFWSMYRHGLLHRVTLSKQQHGLSHAKPVLEVWPNGDFWMNPDLFAQRVLSVIRANFAIFERGTALPVVEQAGPLGSTFVGTVFPAGGARR